MRRAKFAAFSLGLLFLTAQAALAQFPVIDAGQLRSWMTGKKKAVLIDAREASEYQMAHIPGAINIPPERVKSEASRLPKDKTTPLIFYCRGEG